MSEFKKGDTVMEQTEEQKEKRREYKRKWRAANPRTEEQKEKQGEYDRKRRAANPRTEEQKEKRTEYNKKYYAANPKTEEQKESDRKYREANSEKQRARYKKWREANPEKTRERDLQRSYGIDLQFYNNMYKRQSGRCAGCGCLGTTKRGKKNAEIPFLVVDHCHTTSLVRGLLCSKCNTALGMVRDSEETLLKLIEYLKLNRGA